MLRARILWLSKWPWMGSSLVHDNIITLWPIRDGRETERSQCPSGSPVFCVCAHARLPLNGLRNHCKCFSHNVCIVPCSFILFFYFPFYYSQTVRMHVRTMCVNPDEVRHIIHINYESPHPKLRSLLRDVYAYSMLLHDKIDACAQFLLPNRCAVSIL